MISAASTSPVTAAQDLRARTHAPTPAEPPAVGEDLKGIRDKLAAGQRLTREDGLALYAARDLLGLGQLATWFARRKHERKVYYVRNG
ncbi:MAG: hypothetical protein KIS92_25820, partial [Planctomycetota bacterium]|nr:hypothetical protein [Planctomycetota bacterium]